MLLLLKTTILLLYLASAAATSSNCSVMTVRHLEWRRSRAMIRPMKQTRVIAASGCYGGGAGSSHDGDGEGTVVIRPACRAAYGFWYRGFDADGCERGLVRS